MKSYQQFFAEFKRRKGLVWDARVGAPEFDSLRSGPRMRAYMERIGQADAVPRRTPFSERTCPMILGRTP